MRGRLFLACGVLRTARQHSSVTGGYRTRRLTTDTYKQQPPGLSTTAEKQQRNHLCLLVTVTQRPKEELHKDPGSTSDTGVLLSYSNMQAYCYDKGNTWKCHVHFQGDSKPGNWRNWWEAVLNYKICMQLHTSTSVWTAWLTLTWCWVPCICVWKYQEIFPTLETNDVCQRCGAASVM